MVKFEYRDITIEFQSWYDAANWLYYQWDERGNDRIRHMIDSSSSCFMDFTAWVNDNYTPYDILSRCNDDLYADLFEQYLFDLADDLQDDVYDFCTYFTEVEIEEEKPQPDPYKKYYKITYSCGCGETEEYISAETDKEAEKYAYEMAVEDYHSYEGYHGVRTLEEIAVELFNVEDESDLTEDQLMDAEDSYFDEIESTIYWNFEEVSFEEYLENDGRSI